jgi:hypothetical protein
MIDALDGAGEDLEPDDEGDDEADDEPSLGSTEEFSQLISWKVDPVYLSPCRAAAARQSGDSPRSLAARGDHRYRSEPG